MATWLKQSTAADVKIGPFLDETDGKTAETALTITQPDIRLAKNGGAFAQKNAAQTLTHEENGWYEVALDATDTNTLGILIVAIHESGALPVWREFMVVPANVWDSFLGADALQVHAVEITNDLITASAIANNAIDAGAIATGAITAAKFAAGAVDAAALAADAVGEIADGVWDEAVAGHVTAGTFGKTDADILADTNELQTDWVNGGRLDLLVDSIISKVDVIDDFLDTEIADILTDTSTTIDDFVDDLEGRLTAALATQLQAHSLGVGRGVVDALSTTTAVIFKSVNGAAASGTNDFYNGRHIVFTSGALMLQATSISDYVGATKTATVPALTGAPAEDVTFVIV